MIADRSARYLNEWFVGKREGNEAISMGMDGRCGACGVGAERRSNRKISAVAAALERKNCRMK